MTKRILASLAALTLFGGCDGNQQSVAVGGNVTGNIAQSQSGWGNSQSMRIGTVDGKPSPAKSGDKAIDSTQEDPDTGNKQSASVKGSAKVAQSQAGRDNTQSAVVDGSGNIAQSQSGRSNSQSLVIGGNSEGGTPSVTQSQTGVNRKQSLKIDGKKVESTE